MSGFFGIQSNDNWGPQLLRLTAVACITIIVIFLLQKIQNSHAQSFTEKRYKPELVVQTGHAGDANSLAFSPDGKLLASGGGGSIEIWEAATGRQVKSLSGNKGDVEPVAFSPNGRLLASGGDDRFVRFWNTITGQEQNAFKLDEKAISIVFAPDGRSVAVICSYKPTIWIFDATNGAMLRTLNGHTLGVRSIAFSPDSKILVSSSFDRTTRLWDVSAGTETNRFTEEEPTSVRWSSFIAGGEQLAIVTTVDRKKDPNPSGAPPPRCAIMTVKIVEVEGSREVRKLSDECFSGNEIGLGPDRNNLMYTYWTRGTGVIRSMDLRTGGISDLALKYSSAFASFALTPDRKHLASVGGFDRAISLREISTGKEIVTFESRSAWLNTWAFSPDGKMLAAGDTLGNLFLWDLTTSRKYVLARLRSSVMRIKFSPDGKYLLSSAANENLVAVWDPVKREKLHSFQAIDPLRIYSLAVVSFSPDGATLAAGMGRQVRIIDVATGRVIRDLPGQPGRFVAYNRNGTILAIDGHDGQVNLVDLASGMVRTSFKQLARGRTAGFSPDGELIATESMSSTVEAGSPIFNSNIYLWNTRTGQNVGTMSKRSFNVLALEFSPDGRTLASFGFDSSRGEQTVFYWDTVTYKQLPKPPRMPAWLNFEGIYHDFDGNGIQTSVKGGRIVLKDANTERGRAELISLEEQQWAVVTETGLFDASEDAQGSMHFVVSGTSVGFEVIELGQLKNRYHVPGLLQKTIRGEQLTQVREFTVTLPPTVDVTQIKPGLPVFDLRIANRGGGIGRVEVYANEKQVIPNALTGKAIDPKSATVNVTVEIPKTRLNEGSNSVRIVTWNTEGDVRSQGHDLGITLEPNGVVRGSDLVPLGDAKQSYEGHFYAIVAGISDYAGNIDLRYAAKDAEDMTKALALGARKLFCSRELSERKPCGRVHLRLLSTEPDSHPGVSGIQDFQRLRPSKANFRSVFAEVAAKTRPDDVIVIYFAGHGTAITSAEALQESAFPDMYLFPTVEATTLDKVALGNKDVREGTAISSLELASWVNLIRARKKAMIFDTCASGNLENSDLTKQTRSDDAEQIRALDRLRERTGFYVLMGSAPNSVSYEASSFRQGLLTYSLLEAMSGAGLRDDKFVDVEDWFRYSEEKVENLAKGIGFFQHPRYFKSNSNTKSFYVGQIEKEERAQIPLAQPVPLILRPDLQDKVEVFDSLGLAESLAIRLRDASTGSAKGGKTEPINFVAASRAKGGLKPSGLYTVVGEKVHVELVIRRDEKVVAKLAVEGTRSEIVEKLLRAIISAAQSN